MSFTISSSSSLPHTYLDKVNVQTHLQLVERLPDSHEYLYRRVMVAILRCFFLEEKGFDVLQEESRGEVDQAESMADMAVLQLLSRPGGSTYAYDYCLVESKKADKSWTETQDHLSRLCGGTQNDSGKVYGIVHIGLYIQFFRADSGGLTALSGGLHVRNDVNAITVMFENIKRNPLPIL
ncbi:uncharacterized protein K460DRAFT_407722 [Cucurbitaria berberidis CBS 394.84]|uniref:Uncharacterized protein n=1 Tax=Cucurbitaria berberidis CBS 394.84 TaxID=1168544 RepID=A0A9P4L5W6_9PLEO|nr:uncharacterized protein K460DRAFT_407722 [Cucurbitaria berberidis CBS 394.84]KAF1843366.1 hypothetical protein K460DRAFT_407722 [Cucurbitaria berberidis CBS 394.84]